MSLKLQRVGIVASTIEDMYPLLNVADEHEFLQQCMAPEAFQECLQGGETNKEKIQVLCDKVIQEITSGNMKTFDALCEYFLKRSTDYESMHLRFTSDFPTNSDSSSSQPNSSQENDVLQSHKTSTTAVFSLQRIGIVVSNTAKLCTLLNVVDDDQSWLQQFMSPEVLQGSGTNFARVHVLAGHMVKNLVDGNSELFDALCEYLLKRSEAYKYMYQRFTGSGNSLNNANTELLLLQEKVNELTKEVLYWRHKHDSPDSKPVGCTTRKRKNLVENDDELTQSKIMCSEHLPALPCDENTPPCSQLISEPTNETSPPRTPRLTEAEQLKFTFEGMSPVEADAVGVYPPFYWRKENMLQQWNSILKEKTLRTKRLSLPPLVLNEEIMDKLVIVIHLRREKNELMISGGFHPDVPESVSPVNLQLELSLAFTTKDNTRLIVDKQIVATLGHDIGWRIFTLYDFPFATLSLSSAPAATKISIKKICLEQKWFYRGLAPQIDRDDKFDMIDCNVVHGAGACCRDWKQMVEEKAGFFSLPPLLLRSETGGDLCLCLCIRFQETRLDFLAKFHPATSENVDCLEKLLKVEFHAMALDNSIVTRNAEVTFTLKSYWSVVNTFNDLPWSTLSPSDAPSVNVSILPIE